MLFDGAIAHFAAAFPACRAQVWARRLTRNANLGDYEPSRLLPAGPSPRIRKSRAGGKPNDSPSPSNRLSRIPHPCCAGIVVTGRTTSGRYMAALKLHDELGPLLFGILRQPQVALLGIDHFSLRPGAVLRAPPAHRGALCRVVETCTATKPPQSTRPALRPLYIRKSAGEEHPTAAGQKRKAQRPDLKVTSQIRHVTLNEV